MALSTAVSFITTLGLLCWFFSGQSLWLWKSSRFYLFGVDYLDELTSIWSLRGFRIFLGSSCLARNYIPTLPYIAFCPDIDTL